MKKTIKLLMNMNPESSSHPDRDLEEATFQSFAERHSEKPLPGIMCLISIAICMLSAALYAGRNDSRMIGPTLGVTFCIVFAAWYFYDRYCKKPIKKIIGSSKRMQQKHLKKQVLKKVLH